MKHRYPAIWTERINAADLTLQLLSGKQVSIFVALTWGRWMMMMAWRPKRM